MFRSQNASGCHFHHSRPHATVASGILRGNLKGVPRRLYTQLQRSRVLVKELQWSVLRAGHISIRSSHTTRRRNAPRIGLPCTGLCHSALHRILRYRNPRHQNSQYGEAPRKLPPTRTLTTCYCFRAATFLMGLLGTPQPPQTFSFAPSRYQSQTTKLSKPTSKNRSTVTSPSPTTLWSPPPMTTSLAIS